MTRIKVNFGVEKLFLEARKIEMLQLFASISVLYCFGDRKFKIGFWSIFMGLEM